MSVQDLVVGSAQADGRLYRQWFVGDFTEFAKVTTADAEATFGLRHSPAVEVKFGQHTSDEAQVWKRPKAGDKAVTLGILVGGSTRIEFRPAGGPDDGPRERVVELAHQGQYVMWRNERYDHRNVFGPTATMITVRW